MIKTLSVLFVTMFLAAVTGCGSSYEESAFTFGKGEYKFTMYDSTGKKLADGTLNVKSKTSNNVSGDYEFANIYQKDFTGLSSMSGNFEGNINPVEKKVFINTNPRIADSNVFWNMKINKSSLSGEWTYSMFRGTGNKGKIKITKQ
ncbi:MAG: hypothetical protein ABI462_06355 [Ignavibacteria bacterium]